MMSSRGPQRAGKDSAVHRFALGFYLGSSVGIVVFGQSPLLIAVALSVEGVVLWLHLRSVETSHVGRHCRSSDSGP